MRSSDWSSDVCSSDLALPWSLGMAPHHQSDALEIDVGAVDDAEYPAPVDHRDPICKRQDLLQLGGYQQHRNAPRCGCPELFGHVLHCADVEAVRGLCGNQHLRLAPEIGRAHV